MSRIVGFLVQILLLALSFGWHPLATVREVMRQRESYQVRQNGFNWLQRRRRGIEEERERRERSDVGHGSSPGLTDPESVSSVVPWSHRAAEVNTDGDAERPRLRSKRGPGSSQL